MSNTKYAEISGVVKSVTYGSPTGFTIYCTRIDKTFKGICKFFCPLRKGDVLSGMCVLDGETVVLCREPFVQPAVGREAMMECLMICLKKGFRICGNIYDKLVFCAGGEENYVSYLGDLAQQLHDGQKEVVHIVPDIDHSDMEKILRWWQKNRNLRRLYLLGLNNKDINACKKTSSEIYDICVDNPYRLAPIDTEKCEGILSRLNRKVDPIDKKRGEIVRLIYKNLSERGWTATPSNHLVQQVPDISQHIDVLREKYEVTTELSSAYMTFARRAETNVADRIRQLLSRDTIRWDTPIDATDGTSGGRIGAKYWIEASEEQKRAVQAALDHKVSIISARAGTGKTTCLGQIMKNLELRGVSYAVCSFTGKAVSRIKQVTGSSNPTTIHRMMMSSDRKETHLIIDEASMVTTELFDSLLRGNTEIEKITFIGDCNQLPPIGWGSVFSQLILSKKVPTYHLTKNFRVYDVEGETDGVLLNANAIIDWRGPGPFQFTTTPNFSLFEGGTSRVFDIIKACEASGISSEEMVVITPFNRYIEEINTVFQRMYNGEAASVTDKRGKKWAEGDIVMLTSNDPNIGVYNGETGKIVETGDHSISVQFGSSTFDFLLEPEYTPKDSEDESHLDQTVLRLTLAHCVTIDKSQGSEWNYVILYLPDVGRGSFVNKNRIYTGLTRAKRCVWVVTDDIQNLEAATQRRCPYRHENLSVRLSDLPDAPRDTSEDVEMIGDEDEDMEAYFRD